MSHSYNLRSRDRVRAVSECVGPSHAFSLSPPSRFTVSLVAPLVVPFPFDHLVHDCKIHILSYLSATDRGVALTVCKEWNQLMRSATLWSNIDFSRISSCTLQHMEGHCTKACYTAYKKRVRSFVKFLQSVSPSVNSLRLELDIGEREDGWLNCVNTLFNSVRLDDLKSLFFNWASTPAKPYWEGASRTLSNDTIQTERHRGRTFVRMFDTLTQTAPRISTLRMPFEWNVRSLAAFKRLTKLQTLVLEKYFVQKLGQEELDQLFASLPSLRSLVLEVWTPSGRGLQCYSLVSDSLRHLDMSACRGLYITAMRAPQLQVLKVSRSLFKAPFASNENVAYPCVYDVIRDGCPSLCQINEHVLRCDWQFEAYDELQLVLRSVCCCSEHQSADWAAPN